MPRTPQTADFARKGSTPTMDTLYYAPGSASMAVHWLLIELDRPYALERVDFGANMQKSSAYLALNPNGVVPTLVVDGVAHHETGALLMWLAEQQGEAGLARAPGTARRADYLQWMFNLANGVQPLFRNWWYPHEPAGESQAAAVREHVIPRIEAAWERIDAHLAAHGPFLLGHDACTADFLLATLMRWSREMPRPGSHWPHLNALASAMKARPSFGVLLEREGLADWA